jgi:hypothetical protein
MPRRSVSLPTGPDSGLQWSLPASYTVFAGPYVQPQNLALSGLSVHPHGDHHRRRAYPPVLTGLEVGGVKPHVRVRTFERAATENAKPPRRAPHRARRPGSCSHRSPRGPAPDRQPCAWRLREHKLPARPLPGLSPLSCTAPIARGSSYRPSPLAPRAQRFLPSWARSSPGSRCADPCAHRATLVTASAYVFLDLQLHQCLREDAYTLLEEPRLALHPRLA